MASIPGPQGVPDYCPPSQLRRLRGREQAAAVCYRVGSRGVEFLLVRTRGGRWTFPKGGIEPGLTQAQSAALEAFEEAGVHGRIEIAAFARYVRRAPSKSADKSVLVLAFLCEVSRLGRPQERKRKRTWFPAEKAKRRLQQGRALECGDELAAVVDRAVARIRRLHAGSGQEEVARAARRDALQSVRVEASEDTSGARRAASAVSAARWQRQLRASAAIGVAMDARIQKLLPEGAPALGRPQLRLGSGGKSCADTAAKVTSIDSIQEADSQNNLRTASSQSRKRARP